MLSTDFYGSMGENNKTCPKSKKGFISIGVTLSSVRNQLECMSEDTREF